MVADPDTLSVRSAAPSFRLAGPFGREITGESLAGRPVLLVFVPLAFSPICTSEVQDLAAALPRLGGAQVVVASCDSAATLEAWRSDLGVDLTFGSDFWPHGHVARAFAAFDGEHGFPERRTVLLDAAGRVAWTTRSAPGRARDAGDAVAAVAALARAAGSVKR